MEQWRLKVVYLVLLPAIVIAACALGYLTYQTTAQFSQIGEKSIANSVLPLVKERVSWIEQYIITANETVFSLIDPENPEEANKTWKPKAPTISPSIRAIMVLNDNKRLLGAAARTSLKEKHRFINLFLSQILPDLELDKQPENILKHLHKSYAGAYYLISYKSIRYNNHRFYLIAHHDTGYLLRNIFPELFLGKLGGQFYNVVNERNQRVFGPSLDDSGNFVVAHRFPTTLYNWRLQVAPKDAPLLESKKQTGLFHQSALIGFSLVVILLGIIFVLFAAQKERSLNQLKSDFVANVSHELKTPLSVIHMFGEMLLTGKVRDAQKQHKYLETIYNESERLTALIENVLDFAVLEQGKIRYQLQDLDVYEVVEHAVETCRHRFENENVELHLTRRSDDTIAQIDEQSILLVVVNLLDNALKHGGATPVEVAVEASPNEVRVIVRDHGPGIPRAELRRVFERFYRIRSERKTRGAGIGLALVKDIVENHKGRVWAENATDGGAIIGFTLPRHKAATKYTAAENREDPMLETTEQNAEPIEQNAG